VRILLVEDDSFVAQRVTELVRPRGYYIEHATTCESARKALRDSDYQLAVVDVGLPDGTGLDLCREVRSDGLDLPILLLTASNSVKDRVAGLEAGADDYLGKPFANEELVARVRALGRRMPRWEDGVRSYGALVLDLDRRTCSRSGAPVPLTPREFELVVFLAWRDGRVVMRDEVLERVWGDASESGARSLEVMIGRVRRKLDASPEQSCIRTVRQVGYAWALPRS
jgi:two-component system OmpR family response regulator